MKYIVRSIANHSLRLEVYFWIYPKPLISFGTRYFCSNMNLLESVENCLIFSKTIFLIGFKGYYLMAKILAGFLLRLESHRGPIMDLCCFKYILMICLMSSVPLLNCLPIICHFFLLSRILKNQLSI